MGVNNYRYDPFLDVASPVTKTNERASIPASSPYTVRLQEVPLKESPTSLTVRVANWLSAALTIGATTCDVINGSWFAVNDVITIDAEKCLVTNVAGNTLTITRGYDSSAAASHYAGADVFGPLWSEVAAAPASRQFWPDYSTGADSDDSWNTGLLQFNSADAGKQVAISYKGTGTLVDERAFGGLDGFGNYIVEGLTVVPISGLTVGVNPGKAVIAGAPLTQVDQSPIVLTAKAAQLIVKDKTNVNSKVLPKMTAADLVDANTVGLWFPDGSASVPNAAVGVNGNTLAVTNALTKSGTITAVDGWAGGNAAKGDGTTGRYSPANFTGIPSGTNILEFNFLIKIGELGSDQPIVDYGSAAGNQRILSFISPTGTLFLNNHNSNFDTGYVFSSGQFLLFTLQYTGTMFKVYVNAGFGFSLSLPIIITQTFLYFLMQLSGAAYGKHELHCIEIRNALRTPAQIATLAQKLLIPCAASNQGKLIGGTNIGTMTGGGGLAAAYDDNYAQTLGASAQLTGTGVLVGTTGKNWGSAKTVKRVRVGSSTDYFFSSSNQPVRVKLYGSASGLGVSPQLLWDSGEIPYNKSIVEFNPLVTTAYQYHWVELSEVVGNGGAHGIAIAEIEMFEFVAAVKTDIRSALTAPDDSEIIAYVEASATGPRVIIDSSNPKSKSRDRAYGIMVGPGGIGNEEKFSGWEYKAAGAVATIANPFDSNRIDATYYYAEDATGRNMVEIPVSPDGTYGYKPTPTASNPLAITLGSSGIVFLNGAWKTAGYVGAMIRTLDKGVN